MSPWIRVVRATSAAHSGPSGAATAISALTTCMSVAAIDNQVVAAAATAQMARTTSAIRIANGDSGTIAVRFMAVTLALIEATHAHVEAAHAQLMAVTTKNARSFSDNGRQPMSEELAVTKSVQGAVRSSAASLAEMEAVYT